MEIPRQLLHPVVLKVECGKVGDAVQSSFVKVDEAVGGEVKTVESGAVSDTLRNFLHCHVGEAKFTEGST